MCLLRSDRNASWGPQPRRSGHGIRLESEWSDGLAPALTVPWHARAAVKPTDGTVPYQRSGGIHCVWFLRADILEDRPDALAPSVSVNQANEEPKQVGGPASRIPSLVDSGARQRWSAENAWKTMYAGQKIPSKIA